MSEFMKNLSSQSDIESEGDVIRGKREPLESSSQVP